MRLFEIASAEEQMALLKLIMDNTWEALTTQQRQQAAQAQQKAATKPKQVKPRSPKVPYASPPPKLPTPRKQPTLAKPPYIQSPAAMQPQQARVATPSKSLPSLQKASNDSKDGFIQQRSSAIEKQDGKEGRHS